MAPTGREHGTAAPSSSYDLDQQNSLSSPQSEDEIDTQGPAIATADPGLEVSITQQEDTDLYGHQSAISSTSLWESVQPLASVLLPAASLLLALRWLVHKLRRSRRCKPQQQLQEQLEPEPESSLNIFASDYKLEPGNSPRNAQLSGVRCVVAENVSVQGATTGCGVPAVWDSCPVASDPAGVVKKLLNLGVSIIGQGSIQPCNYPTLGSNIRNPVGRFRVAGGGASGAAVAVAVDEADLALGTDYIGSVRIPAACMGLFGFVCTPGTLSAPSSSTPDAPNSRPGINADAGPAESTSGIIEQDTRRSSAAGSSSSGGSLETMGFISADVSLFCRVASFVGLPGAANLRHEVTQVVVAEDLFQLCQPEMAPGILAVKRAVLSWAGNEQAGSVQLLQFLEANTNSWRRLTPTQDTNAPELPKVLAALSHAAQLLYHDELRSRYSSLLSSQPDLELDSQPQQALSVSDLVSEQQLDIARQVQKEVQVVMKTAVKRDVVVVIPCVPAAPPRLDAPEAEQQSWLQLCHAFAALTALAGCPSVVVPTGALADGGPLGLALFGQARTDQRLLAVAHKLMPHVQTELVKLRQQAAADAADKQLDAKSSTKQDKTSQVDPKRVARAEKSKAKGNESYKAGRYMEAIKAYSEAIKQDPTNHLYYSNRAMAYLKIFSFEAAESDCNRVLSSDGLQSADKVKALLRRGTARMHKGDLRGARADFREVQKEQPNNRQAAEELRALDQQERDMADTRRQHALAAAAAGGNGTSPFPPGLNPWDAAAGGGDFLGGGVDMSHAPAGMGSLADPYLAGLEGLNADSVDPGQLEALLRSGGMSVVLGEDGEAVCGPSGEPVIVGPDGQELAIEPSGKIRPYTPRSAMGK